MMTTKDLIKYLQQFPDDMVIGCVFKQCSDIEPLEEDMLQIFDKKNYEEQNVILSIYSLYKVPRYVLRNGRIMEYDELTWPKNEKPNFISVLIFPGN